MSMELKKNPKSDLSKRTFLFFLIGLFISQLFIFAGFSYRKNDVVNKSATTRTFDEDIEIIENTEQVYTPPPPPPPQTIEIVEDDSEADEDVVMANTEVDEKTVVEPIIIAPPVEKKKEAEIFEVVEQMPEFVGGEDAMIRFIAKNFNYPSDAKRFEISGRVLITFVVNEDGSISDVKPLLPENKRLGYGLEEEAIRVVKMMPKWKAGKQRNNPVKVQFILPIQCELTR